MRNTRDKTIIEHWLRLYNRLSGTSFKVEVWPDDDSSKKNIDAMCRDDAGCTLAIEHTLIEPFEKEKFDAAHFLKTLGALENHPALLQPGYMFLATQPVGCVQPRADKKNISEALLKELQRVSTDITRWSHKRARPCRGMAWGFENQEDAHANGLSGQVSNRESVSRRSGPQADPSGADEEGSEATAIHREPQDAPTGKRRRRGNSRGPV